jgi:hypothetical protein
VLAALLASDLPCIHAVDVIARSGGRKVQFSESWFDRTCFGQLTAAMARRRCQELLNKRIEIADETIDLQEELRSKLQTAGQIDIHRFFVQYALLKTQFEFGDVSPKEWQDKVKSVYVQSNPYVTRMIAGLNGESSLYEKTLNAAVNRESFVKVQKAYDDYARKRYATKIDQTLKQVLRNAVDRRVELPAAVVNPLELLEQQADPDQARVKSDMKSVRTAMTDLLLESTEPPEFYGNSRNYINTVIDQIMEVEVELGDVLNEQEIAMFRRLHQMQQPHRRLGIPQMRQRLNLPINQIQRQP